MRQQVTHLHPKLLEREANADPIPTRNQVFWLAWAGFRAMVKGSGRTLRGKRMARRKHSGLDVIAAMPWPAGVVLGVLAFVAVRYGIGWYLATYGGRLLQGFAVQASKGLFASLGVMVMLTCWAAAAVSFLRREKRKHLLDTQTSLESISAMSWQEFEMLVGEAFRRQGYSVEETGLGGADGGIDLILRKNGRTELVQCKHWRNRQIKPATVREMWGLVDHHRADGAKIVCVGEFTRESKAFAEGKALELFNGERLVSLIRATCSEIPQKESVGTETTPQSLPTCPACGEGPMVRRTNRRSGEAFWGCRNYPRCRVTRPV